MKAGCYALYFTALSMLGKRDACGIMRATDWFGALDAAAHPLILFW
jgi:hypothetical protein